MEEMEAAVARTIELEEQVEALEREVQAQKLAREAEAVERITAQTLANRYLNIIEKLADALAKSNA